MLTDPIRTSDGGILITSPLNLLQKDGHVLGVTGESILENYASLNEMNFLMKASPKNAEKFIDSLSENLEPNLQAKYHGINYWFSVFKIQHLAKIFYFIILNQPQIDILNKRGDYNLVNSLKAILRECQSFEDITFPKNELELQTVIDKICGKTGLSDPFINLEELLEHLKKLISEKYQDNPNWTVEWITYQVISWILSNRIEAIVWPENPNVLLETILITNIYSDNSHNLPHNLNIPADLKDVFDKHLGSCTMRHLIYGIMTQNKIRCPAWIHIRPNLCKSCKNCEGLLPSEGIGDDCPAIITLNNFGISNIERRENV